MYFITRDKVREAFRALRAEGYHDPKFETVLEQLGGGSKTTLGKYYGPIKAEFEAMDISGSEPELNQTGGSMPVVQEQETVVQATAPAPVDTMPQGEAALDTAPRPALLEARARYQTALNGYQNINRHVSPLKSQIDPLKTRHAALTAERATVATVERLRVVKAELLDIEEHLEILERQYAPLSTQAEARWPEVSRLCLVCAQMRERAVKFLDDARRQHFTVMYQRYGANPRGLQRTLAALAELVGEEDVAQYVTALTQENRTDWPVPPWAKASWVDAR